MYSNLLARYIRPARRQEVSGSSEARRLVRSVCGLCNGGCGLLVALDARGKLAGIYGDPDNPWNKGHICPKPMETAQILNSPARVLYPLKKERGHFRRLSWEEAMDLIAGRWEQARETYGNAAVAAIISKIGGSHSKFIHGIFAELTGLNSYGTSPICYESERRARISLFGSAATPNPLADVMEARLLLLAGNNLAQTKAGQFHWVQEARRRGTKVIVIDVRQTDTARQADQFIPIRPGTDAALGLALLHIIITRELYDREFVAGFTRGFAGLAVAVREYTPERAEAITGIPAATIEQLAGDLANRKPGLFYPGRGLATASNGTGALLAFEALMAILGNIGQPGGGIISHIVDYGKVQGLIPPELVSKPEKKRDAQEFYEAMLGGEIKVLYVAGNPAVTWPASRQMRAALEKLDLVISHTLLMDDTATCADIVLPATHWLEEASAQASVNRVLQWREAVLEPPGEAKSAAEFFRLLARRLHLPAEYFPPDPASSWELEREFTPSIKGITIAALRSSAGGISYPFPAGQEPRRRLYEDKSFPTPSGKVELEQMDAKILAARYPYFQDVLQAPGNSREKVTDYPFLLSTAKVAYHYHTQCQYSSWARDLQEPCLEINADLAAALGIRPGEELIVETAYGAITLPARPVAGLPPNCVFTQPYYGQAVFGREPANSLFPALTDPVGGGFMHKNLQCRISRALPGRGGK
ncbi:Assimilatory nitrate reductase catalytic subunit [Neomoorella glycerini]|uniref:Assimilatory nitrate reductase catalytic subunit n=1 Tax=Neomoorella glycerini TaxID=55779 RepID=A0A6I5ZNW1_9FIRM|nr:molybdopterin-dependent oxidoreductase [Moorella glycerini]QGP91563.1 Assimilatory nitrate reductase catalytic subunit [Moorella glycerini]